MRTDARRLMPRRSTRSSARIGRKDTCCRATSTRFADTRPDSWSARSMAWCKACAELAPLSSRVAEVRSLVVSRDFRRGGLAARLVGELRRSRARERLRHALRVHARPAVLRPAELLDRPAHWVPEKIATDCAGCPLFRTCGQHAMMLLALGDRSATRGADGETAASRSPEGKSRDRGRSTGASPRPAASGPRASACGIKPQPARARRRSISR